MYFGRERKINRWLGFDYTKPGFYFVTICTKNRGMLFGDVVGEEIVLNATGNIVRQQILWLPKHFGYVKLDLWIVMPNHAHLIIEMCDNNFDDIKDVNGAVVGNGRDRSLQNKPITDIIGALKTTSSKLIHQSGQDVFQWQKSFHDRVIRNEQELINIREYIKNNPVNWLNDRNNPINKKPLD